MPILRNPSGQLVCVPTEHARAMLRAEPQTKDIDGTVLRPGFVAATEAEVAEYHAQCKAAAEAIAQQDADSLARQERSAFAVAKGLIAHLTPGGKKKGE